jgi:hypothetical protein
MVAVYFRTYKDVHTWAHSPMHLKAWKWFNNVSRQHPHLSIMHETYVAPRGHAENIYVNFHRTGLGVFSLLSYDILKNINISSRYKYQDQNR